MDFLDDSFPRALHHISQYSLQHSQFQRYIYTQLQVKSVLSFLRNGGHLPIIKQESSNYKEPRLYLNQVGSNYFGGFAASRTWGINARAVGPYGYSIGRPETF